MAQLLADVGSFPDSAAALAFLADTIKIHGAVRQAVQLYRKAVQLQPGSSSYALQLAHALELDHDYAGVLKVVLPYCERNGQEVLGPLQLQVSSIHQACFDTGFHNGMQFPRFARGMARSILAGGAGTLAATQGQLDLHHGWVVAVRMYWLTSD